VCCSVLRCAAVCCSVLQCVAVWCSVLQWNHSALLRSWRAREDLGRHLNEVEICCSMLQCVAVCCTVLRCGAVCCSVLHCAALCCSGTTLRCLDLGGLAKISEDSLVRWRSVAVCCGVVQCVAVWCSVLQRVAACCSVLQWNNSLLLRSWRARENL